MNITEKKTAIVTGGSRGIGRAVCTELARCGYYIVVNYKSDMRAADETLAMIRLDGGDGETAGFDVSDFGQTTRSAESLISRLGRVDVLINNAGVTADGLFVMMPETDWNSVIDTALKGFYNITRPILKQMISDKRGSIVSVSSLAALVGNRGQANYAAAKAGLIGASRAIASESARLGVRVNVVAPGLIDTEMIRTAPVKSIKELIPMGRIGKPEEVAKVVRFLCSDDASYITGQVISVNGGMF